MSEKKFVDIPRRLAGKQVQEFIRDVKAGLSDEVLEKKYSLLGKLLYLHKVAAKNFLAEKKGAVAGRPSLRISAEHVLEDLRSGLDNEGLMIRYELTERQLQRLFRKIIQAGLMTPLELAGRLSVTSSQVTEAFSEAQKPVEDDK